MSRLLSIVSLVWVPFLFGGPVHGDTGLVNGSFENPIVTANGGSHQYYTGSQIPGWLITGDVDIVRDAFEAGEGLQAVDLNGTNAGSISQTLTGLTPGANYQLSVKWARHPYGPAGARSADVIVNGVKVGSLGTSTTLPPYNVSSFDFTPGTDGSAEIAFVSTSLNAQVGIIIDDVQLSGGNGTPVVSNIGAQTNTEGDSISLQVSASDPDGEALHYTAAGLPPGLALDAQTGLISGFLVSGSEGNYDVALKVDDGNGGTASTVFDWTVTATSGSVEGILVNASFENPIVTANDGSHQYYSGSQVPGWLITGDIDIVRDAFAAGEGSQAVDLNGTNAGSISQTLTGLIVGATYQLAVKWARHPSGSGVRSADVIVNGEKAGSLSTSTALPPYNISTFDFTPSTDGSAEIAFVSTSLNTPVGIVIDDVQLSGAQLGGGSPGTGTPTVSNIGAQTSFEGDTISLQVDASTPDGDSLGYWSTGLPSNLTIDSNTGMISGVLASGSGGNYNVTVGVDDGNGGTASAAFDWAVTGTDGNSAVSLVNGSFEDPIVTANDGSHQYYSGAQVPGWLITGDIDIVRDAFAAGDGSQALDLNGTNAGSISQTLTGLTAGASYQLSVKWARHPYGSTGIRSADVLINGGKAGSLSTETKLPPYNISTFDFVPATDGSVEIAFVSTSLNTSEGIIIDDVRFSGGTYSPGGAGGGWADTGPDPRPAADAEGNVIPDFSRVGYQGGGVALPEVPVVRELSPRSSGDDTDRIQAALDEVAAMQLDQTGLRGAVLLKAGTYRVARHLQIAASGVVLRGEGQDSEGTTIVATGTDHHVFGRNRGHSLIYLGEHSNSNTAFLTRGFETRMVSDVPVGSNVIQVSDASGFEPGDEIAIQVFPGYEWLSTLNLDTKWDTHIGARAVHERKITAIDGNRLTLDVPMTWHLEMDLMNRVEVWGFTRDERVSNVGIEHIRLVSYFNETNHDDLVNWEKGEGHARSGIYIEPVRDAWVRNVTALHFHFAAVDVSSGARNITIQDAAFLHPVSRIKGGKRYGFHILGSRTLVQRSYVRGARHAFVSGPAAYGPNVFLDCLAEENFHESGPHTKWATGFLYDNVTVEGNTLESKRATTGGHGWHGANHVFWNTEAARLIVDDPETRDTNWSIGAIAPRGTSGRAFSPGHWLSHGRRVEQRSLYLWDLQNRLGPRAVERVTTEVQRQGTTRQVNAALQNELAELTSREKSNDDNLLLDYAFQVAGPAAPWTINRGPDKGSDVASLSRTTNPVYSDNTAITVPAQNLLQNGYFFVAMDVATGSPTSYVLEFDYRLQDSGEIQALATLQRIDYNDYWKKIENVTYTESAPGGKWQHFRFEFELEPALDSAGIPYPHILRVLILDTDTGYSIANPSLKAIE